MVTTLGCGSRHGLSRRRLAISDSSGDEHSCGHRDRDEADDEERSHGLLVNGGLCAMKAA